MKKIIVLLLSVLILLSSSGCAQRITVSSNTTADEALLLSALAKSSFKFEYSGAEGYWMTVWMERYEYGELVESKPNMLACSCDEGGQIIFFSHKTANPEEPEMLNIVVSQGGVISDKMDVMQFNSPDTGRFCQYPTQDISFADGRVVLLFVEYYEDAANAVGSEFFTDYQVHCDAIAEMPDVVLLGCEFTTEQPVFTE